MKIKFKKLRPNAVIPTFGHDDTSNAGLDFYLAEGKALPPGGDAWLPTGVAWEPGPLEHVVSRDDQVEWIVKLEGWKPALLVRPRSSMAKLGLEITEGTVDAGYRGEIMIHVVNRSHLYNTLMAGDRIAQGVPILIPVVEVEETQELSQTARGAQGFGSSDK